MALLFSGCSSLTIQYPPFPDQTIRIEDPSKARVYFIRPENAWNANVRFQVYGSDPAATGPRPNLSKQPIVVRPTLGIFLKNPDPDTPYRLFGTIGNGGYLCWEEPPQRFTFYRVQGETNSAASIDLEAGNVYYFRGSMPGFWRPKPTIEIITEEEGQALLKKCLPPDDYRKKSNP